jgi:hypothetical protein
MVRRDCGDTARSRGSPTKYVTLFVSSAKKPANYGRIM